VIVLGEKYRDEISGVEGVATSKTEYLYGCLRVCLEFTADGKLDEVYLDEQRLVPVEAKPTPPQATSGGSRQPTPRTGLR
jgi:hypothetical protein